MARRPDHISAIGTQRLRGRRGVEQRKRRLAAEPLCRDCLVKGVVTASTVPDHIKPLSQGGPDTDDNIRCLCADCHTIRTREQFGQRQASPVSISGRPLDPAHPWNRARPA
ncbi:HNH endonuclease signature motif containing protein [Brevundimonas sp.]|uniref:HNH endonuclease signature motif containing protein n=1 Tax=Brevundimonas sp. TaxID=1871086 RepID=UPI0039C8B0D8